jgi:formylglycine-generating enzyme
MASVLGGSFTMGDRHDAVTVRAFCMDLTEVTVRGYSACVKSGKCSPAAETVYWAKLSETELRDYSAHCNGSRSDRDDHPINCVDWAQSSNYCRVQGKRLPTEEEWEWAARGGSAGRTYPWGDAAPDSQLCWIGNSVDSCAVGSFPSGDAPGGIRDLSGNVGEWTSSEDGERRVVRGGCWFNVAPAVRAAVRRREPPDVRSHGLGLRCVR